MRLKRSYHFDQWTGNSPSCIVFYLSLALLSRLKLIAMILEAKVIDGGCGFYLENLLEKKAVLAVMPLHDYIALNAMQRQWLKLIAYPDDTPTTKETNPDPDSDYKSLVCKIKDYFGERIGLYFLFLIYMTKALVVPGVLGAGAYVGEHKAFITQFAPCNMSLVVVLSSKNFRWPGKCSVSSFRCIHDDLVNVSQPRMTVF